MQYAFLSIRNIPFALVLASEDEYEDEFIANPAAIQMRLNSWVVIVRKGFDEVGHRNYAEYRAGLEDIGFSPAVFLAELLLKERIDWTELAEEELPF